MEKVYENLKSAMVARGKFEERLWLLECDYGAEFWMEDSSVACGYEFKYKDERGTVQILH